MDQFTSLIIVFSKFRGAGAPPLFYAELGLVDPPVERGKNGGINF